ncbi:lipoprotein [Caulobacter phage CcrRogue]|uniref:Uncharacterized protein n=1 Tax=Caulobacter phage CcrRogue TaxID=2927986 RepID=K4JQS2_9CAUD|nr:lipoprotein [Caulobacter phage CcrRogue]AFU86640.1 hypothetical protein CcrRogue_gp158 [Caulobacter phage CcrRogue]
MSRLRDPLFWLPVLGVLVLLLLVTVSVSFDEEQNLRWSPEHKALVAKRARWARMGHEQWLRDEAAKKRKLNYAWRMQIAKVCRQSGQFVLRGTDGRLWLSAYPNPGKVASNGGSMRPPSPDYQYIEGGNVPGAWDPDTYMSPVAAVDPVKVCQ